MDQQDYCFSGYSYLPRDRECIDGGRIERKDAQVYWVLIAKQSDRVSSVSITRTVVFQSLPTCIARDRECINGGYIEHKGSSSLQGTDNRFVRFEPGILVYMLGSVVVTTIIISL